MFEVKIEYKEAWEINLVSYVIPSGGSYDILGSFEALKQASDGCKVMFKQCLEKEQLWVGAYWKRRLI